MPCTLPTPKNIKINDQRSSAQRPEQFRAYHASKGTTSAPYWKEDYVCLGQGFHYKQIWPRLPQVASLVESAIRLI